MNSDKQKLLIELMTSSADTFTRCQSIVKPEYFNPEHRRAVSFILSYYDKYRAIPTTEQIEVETKVAYDRYDDLTRAQTDYCCDEIESFCRKQAISLAVRESVPLIDSEDYGRIETIIKDALLVSLSNDIGEDYFTDPLSRMERIAARPNQRIRFGIGDLDDALGDGLGKTETLLFSANSGVGKSIVMLNLGLNCSEAGYNVAYISLELSQDMVTMRTDLMISGVPTTPFDRWKTNIRSIADDVVRYREAVNAKLSNSGKSIGKLIIKRMQLGTTGNQLRAYLKQYELTYGVLPDLLIVDYLDLMSPNEKVSAENVSLKDKLCSEQLREIGIDLNLAVITASQQNRDALKAEIEELTQGAIAGGITKVNTVDYYAAISATPQMKAAGVLALTFLKARSSGATGSTIKLAYDSTRLRIGPYTGTENFVIGVDKKQEVIQRGNKKRSTQSLDDLLKQVT